MRKGFSLVELMTVIGVLLVLAGFLFPVIANAKASSKTSSCAAQLAQCEHAIALYAADADGIFPAAKDCPDRMLAGSQPAGVEAMPMLADALYPYARSRQIFRCPLDSGLQVYEPLFPKPLALTPSAFDVCGMSFEYRTQLGLEAVSDTRLENPSKVNLLNDLAGHWHGSGRALTTADNFDGYSECVPGYRYNVVYADGHVRLIGHAEVEEMWKRG